MVGLLFHVYLARHHGLCNIHVPVQQDRRQIFQDWTMKFVTFVIQSDWEFLINAHIFLQMTLDEYTCIVILIYHSVL